MDENASVGKINLKVYDQTAQVANEVISQNELNIMRGKGWFVHTMQDYFCVEDCQPTRKIKMECDPQVSGLWVDWIRVVNKRNKAMASFMKTEAASLELTVQKTAAQAKSKRGTRRK